MVRVQHVQRDARCGAVLHRCLTTRSPALAHMRAAPTLPWAPGVLLLLHSVRAAAHAAAPAAPGLPLPVMLHHGAEPQPCLPRTCSDGSVTILQLSAGLSEMALNEKSAINNMFDRETQVWRQCRLLCRTCRLCGWRLPAEQQHRPAEACCGRLICSARKTWRRPSRRPRSKRARRLPARTRCVAAAEHQGGTGWAAQGLGPGGQQGSG